MFTLQDVFDDLAYGELANTQMGNSHLGTIEEKHWPKVVSAINQALVEIFKRLNLRQGTLTLHQQADLTRYYLRADRTEEDTDAMDEDVYIEVSDTHPFEDDIIKVLSAKDSAGDVVRINNPEYPADLFIREYDVVDIAIPGTTLFNADGTTRPDLDVFTLTYQAKYPKIVMTEQLKPHRYKLYLPDAIEEPLLLYTTYKLMRKPTKAAKGEVAASSSLLLEFENSIRKLEHLKLEIDETTERDRLTENRWP